jgi:Zn-dependent peptidase ImmA (M78 family)
VGSDVYPERTMDEVEALADELSQTYSVNHNRSILAAPVPVEDIAEHYLGYSIDFTNQGIFADPEFLGGIDFEQNKIYVNASVQDHDGRYSFTIAHEIGHHVLHRDTYLENNADSEQEILCRDTRDKPQIELEADRFAAALLMPSEAILNSIDAIKPKRKASTIGQARGLATKLIKDGQFSNVSNTAMVNRLIDLNIVPSSIGYQDGKFRGRRRPTIGWLLSRTVSKLKFWG